MRLFWRKGYAATSVEDLTETLHLSRSSLYDTFGDKRRLFLEALKLYSERVLGTTAQTLNESPSPMAGIQKVFDDLIAGVGSETGALGCFMVNSVAELVPYDPDVTAIATTYADSLQQLFTTVLKAARSQNMLTKKQTPEQLATYLFNMIQGMRVLIKSGATRAQVEAISDITLKSLQP
ncbi:MAG TPA: helix-turn-helix domain-containing protein [Anaerolineales bacterium]|nr:helix-turn-helix domain-containing protein [Anaerolineales bacterium]